MKAILITGVSSGIGYNAAKEFASCGYHVFGSVRQTQDAKRLVEELGSNFTPLLLDVTDSKALQNAVQQVETIVGQHGLAGIINNAGIATSGPLAYQSIDEIRWQLEVNVIAPIAIIQTFLPLLKIRQVAMGEPGRILNISSVTGKIAYPFLGAYTGSKHALEGMSHSLRRELKLNNIDVSIIGLGPINTPIWDKKSAYDSSQYRDTEYAKPMQRFLNYINRLGKSGYTSEQAGQLIKQVFEQRNLKARYALVPNPLLSWILPLALPDRWLDRIIMQYFDLGAKQGRVRLSPYSEADNVANS